MKKSKLLSNTFLFDELVKRDFKQKYKRTVLGMLWSILSPLLNLAVMTFVFKRFFGNNTPHYTIYLFCGTLLMSYFKESTTGGMNSLMSNKAIITKINIPKYFFLLSKNVSVLINFGINFLIFLIFCFFDKIDYTVKFLTLIYPVVCLTILNIGVGLILSALFVFFRDISYIYDVFLVLLNYLSVIFYRIDKFPESQQRFFLLNPVYCYIKYFRLVVIEGTIPSLKYHLLCLGYAVILLFIGLRIYKKNNHKFLYYM